MFGSDFESSADMTCDEFAGIFGVDTVDIGIAGVVQQEVVAHTAANEALFDARQVVNGAVDVEQGRVVGVEVGAHLGMDAGGTCAALAAVEVLAPHAVHVGRGSAEVAEVAFEVGHTGDGFEFAQDAFLRSAGDELALVGGDGAESTTAEAATVETDRELDHLVGGDAFASVLGVGQTGVGEVEGSVELALREGLVGWVDDHPMVGYLLEDAACVVFVGFFFDVAEVLGLLAFVLKAGFVAVKDERLTS